MFINRILFYEQLFSSDFAIICRKACHVKVRDPDMEHLFIGL